MGCRRQAADHSGITLNCSAIDRIDVTVAERLGKNLDNDRMLLS